VILVRMVWVYSLAYVEAGVRRLFGRGPYSVSRVKLLVGWMGMRGAVSLAAALALPFELDEGRFDDRGRVVFLTFSVILVTLVLQGLSLPGLIRVLGITDDGSEAREETKARIRAAEAALLRMDELAEEDWVREDTAERMRGLYNFRRSRFAARFDDGDDGAVEERSQSYQRLRRELLEAERNEVVRLRNEGVINDEVMYRVTHDLDLEDARLDV
jgi:monovalent cation/hydrogen antiporter